MNHRRGQTQRGARQQELALLLYWTEGAYALMQHWRACHEFNCTHDDREVAKATAAMLREQCRAIRARMVVQFGEGPKPRPGKGAASYPAKTKVDRAERATRDFLKLVGGEATPHPKKRA